VTEADEVAARVARTELVGAPRAVLVDGEALGDGTAAGVEVRRLLAALGLPVIAIRSEAPTPPVPAGSVAVLGRHHRPVPDCHAWYVGAGATPAGMHPTAGQGPQTAARVLALLGTSLAQERAGAAFRAAGAGQPLPWRASYDAAGILEGITRAVGGLAPPPVAPGVPPGGVGAPDGRERERLLRQAAAALERCCTPGGAIVAAPPPVAGVGPDYGFVWQRDAAAAALALHAIVRSGPPDLRPGAGRRLRAYVSFTTALGPALRRRGGLGTSRCTTDGRGVGGYGDPQPDGPAATALALLTVVPDPGAALRAARPYLDYLLLGPQPGFDLWELTVGTTFHAGNLGRRALRRAGLTAAAAGRPEPAFGRAAEAEALRLLSFAAADGPGLVHALAPRPAWFAATSRLDMSAVGSALLAHDVTDDVLGVDDPRVVATGELLERHSLARWPVNAAWRRGGGCGGGVGRFPEDCNDGVGSTGGSPWPVTTLWAAQHHLRRAQRRAHLGEVDLGREADEVQHALGLLSFVTTHSGGGDLGEQIDGVTGRPRGARGLAWSCAELIVTLLALEPLLRRPAARG